MKNFPFLSLVFVLFVFSSCEDKNEEAAGEKIFAHYQKESQKFRLDSVKMQTFAGKEGTKITIGKKDLQFENGEEPTGEITLLLTEYYKKEDIVLANLSTVSDGQLLESGGMLHLSAVSEGKKLKVKEGRSFKIQFATEKSANMEIFYGAFEDGRMNWKPEGKPVKKSKAGFFFQGYEAGTSKEQIKADSLRFAKELMIQDSIRLGNDSIRLINDSIYQLSAERIYNMVITSRLGWVNCDRFLKEKNLTTLAFTPKKKDNEAAMPVVSYLIFDDIKSIMPSYSQQFINLPIGRQATLVAFAARNDKTFFFSQEITVKKDHTIELELEEVTLEDLKAKLEAALN